jgi:hypothetical protein
MLRARHDDSLRVHTARFEDFTDARPYDAILFQESSQYIDAKNLFERAGLLAARVVVLDEFALRPIEGPLHQLDGFLAAAQQYGFGLTYQKDVSQQAAPTIDYFVQRLPRFRNALTADLGLSAQQVDDLIESGDRYRELYRTGAYAYRMLRFDREVRIKTS